MDISIILVTDTVVNQTCHYFFFNEGYLENKTTFDFDFDLYQASINSIDTQTHENRERLSIKKIFP